jgi:hypothetical protein
MHDNRVDANLLEQRDVVAKLRGEVAFLHGVPAVFYHNGGPGVAA